MSLCNNLIKKLCHYENMQSFSSLVEWFSGITIIHDIVIASLLMNVFRSCFSNRLFIYLFVYYLSICFQLPFSFIFYLNSIIYQYSVLYLYLTMFSFHPFFLFICYLSFTLFSLSIQNLSSSLFVLLTPVYLSSNSLFSSLSLFNQ